MIDDDSLDIGDIELFELPNNEILNLREGPPVRKVENGSPLLDCGVVEGIFSGCKSVSKISRPEK